MSKKPTQHYLLDFATRNARLYLPTLNAASAIRRLEELIEDVNSLQHLRSEAERQGLRFGSRLSTYEIINYYVVSFATCLEWHARSRIVDFLNFRPDCIESADVRVIDKIALSQMTTEKATLPYIVGAGTKVSSARDYTSIFDRIFDGIRLPEVRAEKLLREQVASKPQWRVASDPPLTVFDAIEELFVTRNELVHEVGPSVMAHFSLRDMWTLEEALRVGQIALTTVKTVEQVITERTQSEFPNRVDSEGYPEDELKKLAESVSRIEDQISSKIGFHEWNNADLWKASLSLHRVAFESEMKFVEGASFLRPVRNVDFTQAAKIQYLQGRQNYLKGLLAQLDETMGTSG